MFEIWHGEAAALGDDLGPLRPCSSEPVIFLKTKQNKRVWQSDYSLATAAPVVRDLEGHLKGDRER